MIVGVHGPLNGGKDTVATLIQEIYPGKFNRYAFAKPIKEACQIMFGFSSYQIEDRVIKEEIDPFWGFSPRKVMQLLGTEYGRDMLRKDVWIQRARLEVEINKKKNLHTIITDVRFENEAEWVRSENAILIRLKVPNLIRDEKYSHASEAGITEAFEDLNIINDKDLGLGNLKLNLYNALSGYTF